MRIQCEVAARTPLARLGASLSLFLVLAFGLLLGGCAPGRGGPIAYDVPNFTAPDAPRVTTLGADYRITQGDKLNITVYQVKDLSGEYTVDLAGNIGLPLIGNVQAVGVTPAELRDTIKARLGARYLRNPDVTVGVLESRNNNVTVEGGVRQPGVFALTGPSTLIQAIALARGIDVQSGNARRVAIFRRIQGQRMAAAFDLVSIRRGEMQDPEIYPGDIVVVESNTRRTLFQEVLSTLPLLAMFRPY